MIGTPGNVRTLVWSVALGAALASPYAHAQPSERSGKQVVDQVCAACHASGAKGAPRIGDQQAWAPLASRGLSSLTESALKGIRNMPPHGGNPGLSDVEIERAITHMVNQSGGRWVEPLSGLTPAVERRGEEIVQQRCAECHQTGVNGAPRIGDRSAWIPRLKYGIDFLVRSAIHGHGAMPPRGGMADLADTEIRGAIVYMLNPAAAAKGAPVLPAAPSANHKIVDGTEVYFGIVSADALRAQKNDKARAMHGGIPRGKDYYHVNVSLFDAKTRGVIADAKVEASVGEPGLAGETKKLEPVVFNDMTSYGNYFHLSGKHPYTIRVHVRRPGVAKTLETAFEFKP